jgi:hypothetical protein
MDLLKIAEERIEELEEQLIMLKKEAAEQRARAEAAESRLKLKNRRIILLTNDIDENVPSPSRAVENWDIPERRHSFMESPLSTPSPIDRRMSLPIWPSVVVQVPTADVVVVASQVLKTVKAYEKRLLSRKDNPLWTKEILCGHATNLGINPNGKNRDQLIEDMRFAIENDIIVSNPSFVLNLYEKRLPEVSVTELDKDTIEEHCKYYGISIDGKRKPKLWDELRDVIKRK